MGRLRAWTVVACFGVLFVVPLWASGETWARGREEPVSHLEWDEGQRLPGHAAAPQEPGAGMESPLRHAVSLFLLPAVLLLAVAWTARARGSRATPRGEHGSDHDHGPRRGRE